MIHSLEHVPDPGATLAQLQGALSADGLLLIQVPDASRNPFDLLVADHRSHFSRVTLERLTAASGMMTVRDTPAVPRELSWLGCRTTGGPAREPSVDGDFAAHHVAWLNALLALVDRDGPEPLGFFGSSIAANWVLARERPRVRFLVDEDPSRHGAVIAGRPVLRPEDVPAPATVVMPFSPDIAGRIAARLTRPGIRYVHP
jgi:hypothetical protein